MMFGCWWTHHYHNLGAVRRVACGASEKWEWQCCKCGKRARSGYVSLQPGYPFNVGADDWTDVAHAERAVRR